MIANVKILLKKSELVIPRFHVKKLSILCRWCWSWLSSWRRTLTTLVPTTGITGSIHLVILSTVHVCHHLYSFHRQNLFVCCFPPMYQVWSKEKINRIRSLFVLLPRSWWHRCDVCRRPGRRNERTAKRLCRKSDVTPFRIEKIHIHTQLKRVSTVNKVTKDKSKAHFFSNLDDWCGVYV